MGAKSRLAFAAVVFSIAAGLAYAQSTVTAIGPITPGHCSTWFSTTQLEDSGVACGTSAGTVSSVGLALPVSVFSISGSPVTNNGTLTGTFINQSANTVFAGPVNGAAATPAFRILSGADLPLPSTLTPGGVRAVNPVTSQWVNSISTGGIPALSQPAFLNISGLVDPSQIPNPTTSTLGGVQAINQIASQWINSINGSGVPQLSQPQFTDIGGTLATSQLPSSGNNTVLSNIAGSTGPPSPNSLSAVLDSAFSSVQGSVLYRGASGWLALGPGINGQVFTTSGANNNPLWTTVSGTGTMTQIFPAPSIFLSNPCTTSCVVSVASAANNTLLANTAGSSVPPVPTSPSTLLDIFSTAQGSLLTRGASIWFALTPGTAGFPLLSNGPGTTPSYGQLASTSLSDTVSTTNCTVTDQSGASLSILSSDCKYYKLGKVVIFVFNITYPSTANGSNALVSIPVLPIGGLNAPDQTCPMILGTTAGIVGRISIGASTMAFYNQVGNALYKNSALSALNMYGSCAYLAN